MYSPWNLHGSGQHPVCRGAWSCKGHAFHSSRECTVDITLLHVSTYLLDFPGPMKTCETLNGQVRGRSGDLVVWQATKAWSGKMQTGA